MTVQDPRPPRFAVGDRVTLDDPGSTALFGGKPAPHGPGEVVTVIAPRYAGSPHSVTVRLDGGTERTVCELFVSPAVVA